MRSAKSKLSGGILIIFLVFSLIATFSIATADSTEDGWNTDSDDDEIALKKTYWEANQQWEREIVLA